MHGATVLRAGGGRGASTEMLFYSWRFPQVPSCTLIPCYLHHDLVPPFGPHVALRHPALLGVPP